jgi:hypothetical protein
MQKLLEITPALRTADEWRHLLGEVVDSLSSFLGVAFKSTSWFVHDDIPGYASSCNCVDVWATLSEGLSVHACGVVCLTLNFGEGAWLICDLILYASRRRLKGPPGMDLIRLSYNEQGWVNHGWGADEYGEWEAHTDPARWGLLLED